MTQRLTAAVIQHRVAVAYGLDLRMLLSERRARHLARPRQVAMWLCARLLPGLSLPQIGRAFRRDHTTVLHAIRKIEQLRLSSPAFAELADRLQAQIAAATLPPAPALQQAEQASERLLRLFQHDLLALVHRDPERALALFHRWQDELAEEVA